MINETTWQFLQALWPPRNWEAKCIDALKAASFNGTHGLVNEHGLPISTLNENAWGIDLRSCHEYCNSAAISFPVFDFGSFAACLTNYLLPWLTLTAQLPYETGDPWSNTMSFFLAVGSPALVTFSLTITIMNRAWIRDSFRDRLLNFRHRNSGHVKQMESARFLLQEGQQVPLRACQERGCLRSLIVLPENKCRWVKLDSDLRKTRRGITASLVAQTLFATLAYVFIIISSFDSELGDPITALQIASGSLWIWLVPVIWGWITVGTQSNENSIEDALVDNLATRVTSADDKKATESLQLGIFVHTQNQKSSADSITNPKWCGASAAGDEQRKGPIYNYARILTWWKLAHTIEGTFSTTLESAARSLLDAMSVIPTKESEDAPDEIAPSQAKPRLPKPSKDSASSTTPCNIDRTATRCGSNQSISTYPEWRELDSDSGVWRRLWVASLAALTLQWGTTGASILIAYQTPTRGLSCRSGSYMIYGSMGTLAWACLLISMLSSHQVMLRCQRAQSDSESTRLTTSFAYGFYCATAVCLRRTGKFLAGLNALWLIASSLMEFIGLYDNCWCSGTVPGLGDSGWIVLFKNKQDLRNSAIEPWIGGTTITFLTCAVACIGFNLGCWDTDRQQTSRQSQVRTSTAVG